MYNIDVPYPLPFDPDAARQEERRRRALATLDAEAVLACVIEALGEQPLAESPLRPLILFMLDKAWTPGDGGGLFDGLKQAVTTQVERLLDETLADPTAWED